MSLTKHSDYIGIYFPPGCHRDADVLTPSSRRTDEPLQHRRLPRWPLISGTHHQTRKSTLFISAPVLYRKTAEIILSARGYLANCFLGCLDCDVNSLCTVRSWNTSVHCMFHFILICYYPRQQRRYIMAAVSLSNCLLATFQKDTNKDIFMKLSWLVGHNKKKNC